MRDEEYLKMKQHFKMTPEELSREISLRQQQINNPFDLFRKKELRENFEKFKRTGNVPYGFRVITETYIKTISSDNADDFDEQLNNFVNNNEIQNIRFCHTDNCFICEIYYLNETLLSLSDNEKIADLLS